MFIVIGGTEGQKEARVISVEELQTMIENAVQDAVQRALKTPKADGKPDEILRYNQVLKILRISQPTLTRLERSGQLRVVKLGSRKRGVLRSELNRFMVGE